MLKCTTGRYDELYAIWLKDPLAVLYPAKWQRDEPLLDLCGGTGVISKALLCPQPFGSSPTPKVTLFDLNPRPGKWAGLQEKLHRFYQVWGDANLVDTYFKPESFGVVVCRQAMGYLDPAKAIPAVATILKPGGRFVFNTFIDPKLGRALPYSYKWYKFEFNQFFEARVVAFNRVLHVQAKLSGIPGVDVTLFKYHPEQELRALLSPWFSVEVTQVGRGLHWLCTRQPEK